ncbi:hypothetical protein ACE6H2_021279 [Prunus campanulata]
MGKTLSSLKFFGFGLEGYFGYLCLAPARCRTRTRFGSDSKVEFGSRTPIHFADMFRDGNGSNQG